MSVTLEVSRLAKSTNSREDMPQNQYANDVGDRGLLKTTLFTVERALYQGAGLLEVKLVCSAANCHEFTFVPYFERFSVELWNTSLSPVSSPSLS